MERVDAIVIGSSYGGAIPALRLAEAGRKVLVLERGVEKTSADFKLSYSPANMFELYGGTPNVDLSLIFRYGQLLGGGSVVNSGMMPRAPSEAFAYVDPRDGLPVWPAVVNRAALDPYYEIAEKKLFVSRVAWDEVPANGAAFAHVMATAGHSADRAPFNFVGCLQTGFCEVGCKYDRKMTMLHTYIPAARELGVEFRTRSEARTVRPSAGGYTVTYRTPGGEAQAEAPVVVLGAGAIMTAALLLRSAPALPNLSKHVGHYLNNNGDIAAVLKLPADFPIPFTQFKGRTNATLISYSLWKSHGITVHTGCVPPGVFAGLDMHAAGGVPWGLEAKRLAHEIYLHRMLGLVIMGLCPAVGRLTIDAKGEPLAFFDTALLEDYKQKAMAPLQDIAAANRAELLQTTLDGYDMGGAHPMGTCRMAETAARGVVDPYGRVFGYPGMYIADGSVLSGSTGTNPAITIAANAERIAAQLVADL